MYYRRGKPLYSRPSNAKPRPWNPKFKKPSECGTGLTDDCMGWLSNYSGQDVFISSLKSQFVQKGELSASQWKLADKNYQQTLNKVQPPNTAKMPTKIAPPKPNIVKNWGWNPKLHPWKVSKGDPGDLYTWEMGFHDFTLVHIWVEEYGKNLIFRVLNQLTANSVDFTSPIMSSDRELISMIGYHKGTPICLHIKYNGNIIDGK